MLYLENLKNNNIVQCEISEEGMRNVFKSNYLTYSKTTIDIILLNIKNFGYMYCASVPQFLIINTNFNSSDYFIANRYNRTLLEFKNRLRESKLKVLLK